MTTFNVNRPFEPQQDALDYLALSESDRRRGVRRESLLELIAYLVAGGLLYMICRMVF